MRNDAAGVKNTKRARGEGDSKRARRTYLLQQTFTEFTIANYGIMNLLSPFDLGPLRLPNRAVMAPMTRSRHPEAVPNALTATYYAQRASAGLIVSEATQVDPRGQGYPDTPGIYNDAQVAAWRGVTDLVHAVGGRIFLQLWHVGRVSHSAYHGGALPVAPSALPAEGKAMTPDFRLVPFETPHALTTDEIAEVVGQFGRGARLAKEAGFDGVEIHGANGYLIEQFLSSGSNHRDDDYGGSAENRVRFLSEVTEAVLESWDPERVGVRLAFGQGANGVYDDAPAETFGLAAQRMNEAGLVYIHAVRPSRAGSGWKATGSRSSPIRSIRLQPSRWPSNQRPRRLPRPMTTDA